MQFITEKRKEGRKEGKRERGREGRKGGREISRPLPCQFLFGRFGVGSRKLIFYQYPWNSYD